MSNVVTFLSVFVVVCRDGLWGLREFEQCYAIFVE